MLLDIRRCHLIPACVLRVVRAWFIGRGSKAFETSI